MCGVGGWADGEKRGRAEMSGLQMGWRAHVLMQSAAAVIGVAWWPQKKIER